MINTSKYKIVEHKNCILIRKITDGWDNSYEISKNEFKHIFSLDLEDLYDIEDSEIDKILDRFLKIKIFL
jgi:hypothetical protein